MTRAMMLRTAGARVRRCDLHGNAAGDCPICDMDPAQECEAFREIADRIGGDLGDRLRTRAAAIERAIARAAERDRLARAQADRRAPRRGRP